MISRSILGCFSDVLGAVFLILAAQETGLQNNGFSARNAIPRPVVEWRLSGLVFPNQQTAMSGQNDLRNAIGIRSPQLSALGKQGLADDGKPSVSAGSEG